MRTRLSRVVSDNKNERVRVIARVRARTRARSENENESTKRECSGGTMSTSCREELSHNESREEEENGSCSATRRRKRVRECENWNDTKRVWAPELFFYKKSNNISFLKNQCCLSAHKIGFLKTDVVSTYITSGLKNWCWYSLLNISFQKTDVNDDILFTKISLHIF